MGGKDRSLFVDEARDNVFTEPPNAAGEMLQKTLFLCSKGHGAHGSVYWMHQLGKTTG